MIDWTHVKDLKADMGEAFDEIIEVFQVEVEEALARLPSATTAESLAAELHFLKGAALNLGFEEFASLCAEGETRAASGSVDAIDLARIADCFADSRAAFVAGLVQHAA